MKKKRRNDGDEDSHVIENTITDDSDGDESHTSVRKKQRRQKQKPEPEEHVDMKKSKTKQPVPHKARALNDALKDFQSNFGISSPSTKGILLPSCCDPVCPHPNAILQPLQASVHLLPDQHPPPSTSKSKSTTDSRARSLMMLILLLVGSQ